MFKIRLRYPKLFKYSCMTATVSSIGWILYQIKTTRDILNEAMDYAILNVLEQKPKLIYAKPADEVTISNFEWKLPSDQYSTWDLIHSFKFVLAQRLVTLCRNESTFIRLKALSRLASINSLDNWHCSILANMIDEKTAVSLSRIKGVDTRLFAEPPLRYLSYDHKMIVNEMKDFLVKLYESSKHPCLAYFISKVFFDEQEQRNLVDDENASSELTKFLHSHRDLLHMCLESVLHHSSFEKYAKDIVKHNGLPLLLEMYNRFKNDQNVNVTLCRIISYLSFHPEFLDDLFRTGWIGILSKWLYHDDIRISVPAARALANLDRSESKYLRHIYLLHPTNLSHREPRADIVFVHGLLGGVFFTWRQRNKKTNSISLIGKRFRKDSLSQKEESMDSEMPGTKKQKKVSKVECSDPNTRQYLEEYREYEKELIRDYEIVLSDIPETAVCDPDCKLTCLSDEFDPSDESDGYTFCWPKDWLPEDFDNLRIIGVNYETTLSMWNSVCPNISGKTNIDEQSNRLIQSMIKAGLGKRPIIWVTHSMGGLLVKNILCKAFDSENEDLARLCSNTKGIIFFSTPHFGSSFATFNQASQYVIWPSIEVQDLRENSPILMDMHKKFLNILETFPIKILAFVETKKTVFTALKFNFRLVTKESGNPGVGEYYEIPLDHLGICKPLNKYSFLYQKLVQLIRETLEAE